ncbi:hypothetical protein ROZALSC1DRAFT_28785 [Rozella allomycis CSF55]|uniref:Na+/H+ antiporter NhaC-like C-terminal domain-containing protein n=1 Tax=Rozella allomycis (strain CSF55) TaxID=988480 RepID=A0A4P9YKG5_ROZAC|nr:hypothetical protein ROZALSC1DRAFT_28785 [Rozella allomycis CSF55]
MRHLNKSLSIKSPLAVLRGIPFSVSFSVAPLVGDDRPWKDNVGYYTVYDGEFVISSNKFSPYDEEIKVKDLLVDHFGEHEFKVVVSGSVNGEAILSDTFEVYCIPGILSILPSIITVALAMWLKQNILALFIGICIGSTFIYRYNPITGIMRAVDTIVVEALADSGHASVIYFCLLIGGMIAVIGKGGGAKGMAQAVTKFAKTRRSAQLVTFFVGIFIFFDDYASCLITGSTMRDIGAQLKISREKLSFIVDTCAATISCLFIVSSWVGVEVTQIEDGFKEAGIEENAYSSFLNAIPYKFYPILVLIFTFITIITGKDFGPMYRAERRAVVYGKVSSDHAKPVVDVDDETMSPKSDKPQRWYNAVIPFLVIIFVVFGGMVLEGYFHVQDRLGGSIEREMILATTQGQKMRLLSEQGSLSFDIQTYLSKSDSFHALIWGSLAGSFVAIFLVVAQRILTLSEAMDAWLAGCKSMIFAILILAHAWGLGNISNQLQTSDFMTFALKGNIPAGLLPTIVFILGAGVSFATGSAWGTMSILFPLVIPLVHDLAKGDLNLLYASMAAILSGSVWGNHTSPIADSCIMSSMSTGCDHEDHVKSQALYAIIAGIISILFCTIPVGFGLYPFWAALLISIAVMIIIIMLFGRKPEDSSPTLASKLLGRRRNKMDFIIEKEEIDQVQDVSSEDQDDSYASCSQIQEPIYKEHYSSIASPYNKV